MAIHNTYIKIIRCHERIHSPKMYSHYFNIWRTCQNKSTIYCISKLKERHMLCYGLSFFCLEKLPALHNKIRKFSKKSYTLRYFPFENKRYEQHMSKTTQKNNNSHDNCLCKSTNFTLCCERAYTVKLLYFVKKRQFPLIMLPTKTCNFN